jgi:hypothetical protein
MIIWFVQPSRILRTGAPGFLEPPRIRSILDGGGYVWHCHIIRHEGNEIMRRTSAQERRPVQRAMHCRALFGLLAR